MVEGSLNVTPDSLKGTGNSYTEIGGAVRTLYQNVVNSIDSITSKKSWQGESAIEYKEAFQTISVGLKARIEELNQLGPKIISVAQGYQDTDDESAASFRKLV